MGLRQQAIIDRLNKLGTELPQVDFEVLSWRETAEWVGLLDGLDDSALEFMSAWPAEMMESVTALFRAASRNGAQLRFAWTPAYDFAMTISKSSYDDEGPAEYTVHLSSRYPPELGRTGK